MLFRSTRVLLLAWGTAWVLGIASPVNAAPTPGDATSSFAPSGANDPIGDLRKANDAYKKAADDLSQANVDLATKQGALPALEANVTEEQGKVNSLKCKLRSPQLKDDDDYNIVWSELTAENGELLRAQRKMKEANSDVSKQQKVVDQRKATADGALKELPGKVDAASKFLDAAAWPHPASPPIYLPLRPMPGGCPADALRPW